MVDWQICKYSFDLEIRLPNRDKPHRKLEEIIKNFCNENDGIELDKFRLEVTPYIVIKDE